MNFGKAVKVVCAMRGMRRSELAKRAGMSDSAISRFAVAPPSIRTIMRVCAVLECPPFLLVLLASEGADDLYGMAVYKAAYLGEQLLTLLNPVSPTR